MSTFYSLVSAKLPDGAVHPAIIIDGNILLTYPGLTLKKLTEKYETAVIKALKDPQKRQGIIAAVDSGTQHMLLLEEEPTVWKAPISVYYTGEDGMVIALLHHFSAP